MYLTRSSVFCWSVGNKTVLYTVSRYGFRRPPYLELKARPKLGEREVTLVHVTEWIERKLEQEFQVCFLNVFPSLIIALVGS